MRQQNSIVCKLVELGAKPSSEIDQRGEVLPGQCCHTCKRCGNLYSLIIESGRGEGNPLAKSHNFTRINHNMLLACMKNTKLQLSCYQ